MKIGLLSDTHGFLDEKILEYFAECDELWHAGDIGDLQVAGKLEKFKPLRAVYGNIDGQEIRIRYPEHLKFTVQGLKVWITHIGGYPGNYDRKIRHEIREDPPDLFICGHSHILKVIRDSKLGLLHMNPGAAGKHGFHKIKTMLRFDITAGKIANVEAIELGMRGAIE
jgi:putative phosphoesterase